MLDLGRPLDVVALGSRGTSQPAAGPVWARSAVRRWLRLDIWSRLDVGPIRAERRQPPGRPSERPLPGDTAAGRVPAAFPIRAIRCQPAPSASCSGTGSGRRPASILFRARQALRPEGRIGCRACRAPSRPSRGRADAGQGAPRARPADGVAAEPQWNAARSWARAPAGLRHGRAVPRLEGVSLRASLARGQGGRHWTPPQVCFPSHMRAPAIGRRM